MKHLNQIFPVLLILLSAALQGQNITEIGSLTYSASLSDIWGYEDGTGHEYALVGVRDGLSIVDVSSDPANPVEVQFIGGPASTWRDIKVWGDHCYVMHDSPDPGEPSAGLLVVDLSGLPASVDTVTIRDFGSGVVWQTAHNLFIDEFGYLYICGANYSNGGVIITDLNPDPMSPTYAGLYDLAYVHDLFVRDNIMWTGEIYNGWFGAVDVNVKSSPILLATQNTPSNFTHNVWLSDDDNTLFTTDEVGNGYVGSYDVSDLSDISELDRVQSSPGDNVIPHNTFVLGDHVLTSYYADGVTVHNATYPDNVVQVGGFDTSPNTGTTFNGCWGVYPYTTSGLVYATDVSTGLFILDVDYVDAAYLEGVVSNEETLAPIFNATVTIEGGTKVTNSDLFGVYKSGTESTGVYDVTFSATGYESKTITGVSLTAGSFSTLDVELKPFAVVSVSGSVVDGETGDPIANAEVIAVHPDFEFSTTADASGNYTLSNIFETTYDLVAGKWGHITKLLAEEELDGTTSFDIELDRGYYDDFVFESTDLSLRWRSLGASWAGGAWQAEIPEAYSWFYPNEITNGKDAAGDIGDRAFLTGNSEDFDFLHAGAATLISPEFDPRYLDEPMIRFSAWVFNTDFYGAASNDFVLVKISDDVSTVTIDTIRAEGLLAPQWREFEYRISDYMTPTAGMQLIVLAEADGAPFYLEDLLEAGFDYFRIEDETISGAPLVPVSSAKVYPNPADSRVIIELDGEWSSNALSLRLYGITGKLISTCEISSGADNYILETADIREGVYLYEITDNKRRLTGKIVVHH